MIKTEPAVLDVLNDPEIIKKLDYIESRLEQFTEDELDEFANEFAESEFHRMKSQHADLEFRALVERIYKKIKS